jgi:phosphoglycolate phosphatase-like HAD superfamily hydrolase
MTHCILNDYNASRTDSLSDLEHEEILFKTVNMFHNAIGWDSINGQLLPSAPLSAGSWNDILKLSSDALVQSNCISNAIEKVQHWHENCGDVHANDKTLIPDLPGFMKSIKDIGLLVAICTSDDRKATDQCIRNWGLENYVDVSKICF